MTMPAQNSKEFHAKAPFRLGLAGGGTDVSPYSDLFGGAVINSTVSLYAWTTIRPRTDNKIIIASQLPDIVQEFESTDALPYLGELDLAKGVYNVLLKKYKLTHTGFNLLTKTDVPTGSGLGTSSTIVVSILGAFLEWFKISLSKNEIAQLAFYIEREELKMTGGKQDQYAATYGGINFMEFFDNKVVVTPIALEDEIIKKIKLNLLLYYTKTNRESSLIIEQQIENVKMDNAQSITAMHNLKANALLMKAALESNNHNEIGMLLNDSWVDKKSMASGITNEYIDSIYETAKKAGATGGKISGAGGGGFMLFFADKSKTNAVITALQNLGGDIVNYEFTQKGLETWTVK